MSARPVHLLAVLLALGAPVSAAPIPAERVELVPATAQEVLGAARAAGAKVAIVNLWASWCIPCREEFPDLVRFYQAHRDDVALFFVSGDFASDTAPAREFLADQGVDFRTYLKTQKDAEFIDAFDPEWSGALPATFLYDAGGVRRRSLLHPVTYDTLQSEVDWILEQQQKKGAADEHR